MFHDLLSRVSAKVKHSYEKRAFERVVARVLRTSPLAVSGDSPVFFTQLCHRDLAMYLVALKSIYTAFGQGRVCIIDDGTLTAEDLKILNHHIPGIMVKPIGAIDTGVCPRGGTWERLTEILAMTADNFVIQLDADTLVSSAIPDVIRCWRENKSFLLGTDCAQTIMTAIESAQMVQGWIRNLGWPTISLGVEAQAALDEIPDAARKFYVCGSSGFAGFAKGAFQQHDLEQFSMWMQNKLGDRWAKWGSEQIGSNYVLANAPNAIVLPFDQYSCFEPILPKGERAFLHFIGSYRFDHGVYRRRAAEFIAAYTALSR